MSGTGVALATFTLSGIVTETPPTTARRSPACASRVARRQPGTSSTTGADGRYQISGVVNGGYTVSATVSGYTAAGCPSASTQHDLDFRLDRSRRGRNSGRASIDACRHAVGRYYSDPVDGCRFSGCAASAAPSDAIADVIITSMPANGSSTCRDRGFHDGDQLRDLVHDAAARAADQHHAGSWIVGAQITPGTYRADTRAGVTGSV